MQAKLISKLKHPGRVSMQIGQNLNLIPSWFQTHDFQQNSITQQKHKVDVEEGQPKPPCHHVEVWNNRDNEVINTVPRSSDYHFPLIRTFNSISSVCHVKYKFHRVRLLEWFSYNQLSSWKEPQNNFNFCTSFNKLLPFSFIPIAPLIYSSQYTS